LCFRGPCDCQRNRYRRPCRSDHHVVILRGHGVRRQVSMEPRMGRGWLFLAGMVTMAGRVDSRWREGACWRSCGRS
jgi:hypothetical protein